MDITQNEILQICRDVTGSDSNIHIVISQTPELVMEDVEERGLGYVMPYVSTMKQIMKAVVEANTRGHTSVYMFLMPCLHTKERNIDFLRGVESVKDGVVMDFITYKKHRFDRPHVFIFAQQVPPFLSKRSKWKLYNHKEL